MPEIKVQMNIDHNGVISFHGEPAHVDAAARIYNNKLTEARMEGKEQIVQSMMRAVENFARGNNL